jgi:predicted transcriptional regulator of viral defense system
MTQRDRDRPVVLKKAQKKLITQRQAAGEPQVSERQVRRLLGKLKDQGDRGLIHGLRGQGGRRSVLRLSTAEHRGATCQYGRFPHYRGKQCQSV